LNNIIDEPARAGPERSPQRTHHTGSHRALKAVRIANSNDQLPHPYSLRITELRWEQMRCANAHHGQISRRVITNQVCSHTTTIGQGHKDAARVMHDMAIRQNKTIRSKNEARARTPCLRSQTRIGPRPVARLSLYLNVHHRRAHLLCSTNHCLGIGIE
jgi:hypothetical protein